MFTVYAIYNLTVDMIYIGSTNNINRRIVEHNTNKAHFTGRLEGMWELIYQESVATRSEAIMREKQLKTFRGREFVKKYIPG